MSAGDVERIRKGFDAFARGDQKRAFANLADDFQVIDHVLLEDSTRERGPHALAANVAHVHESFESVTWEMLEAVDLGDQIVVRVLAKARSSRGGGLETKLEAGQLWTVRDGKALKLEIFPTFEDARSAADAEM